MRRYGWLTLALAAIYRDFMPEDLAPILVQAAPSEAETAFMLWLADMHSFTLGVVGWTDFEVPAAAERIVELSRHPKLKGLRPMIQDIEDDEWMLRSGLNGAFRAMAAHDLVFDALIQPRHLACLALLLAHHSSSRAVIDHCAKPAIAASGPQAAPIPPRRDSATR